MKRIGLALVVVVAATAPALAQFRAAGGDARLMSVMLLGQKSVQEDLKLSKDQVKKIDEFQSKAQETFRGLGDLGADERKQKMEELTADMNKLFKETLKPGQVKRVHQIALQQGGLLALSNPDVDKELKLTDEQKEKIKQLSDEARKEGGAIFTGEGSREEKMQKFQELRDSSMARALKVLTPEQRDKWKELAGEPFKGRIQFGPPGGRPREKRSGEPQE